MSAVSLPLATSPIIAASTIVIDTSVWVSWLLPTDSNHTVARNWINQHIQNGGSFISPTMLVIETASSIARVTNRLTFATSAASQLYTIPFITLVPISQSLVDETVTVAAQYKLRGADAIFVALAKIRDIPLVSFDHEQLTRPANVIATIRP